MKKEYYLKYNTKGNSGDFWYIKEYHVYLKEYYGTQNIFDALLETKDEILNIKEFINYKNPDCFDFYIEKASEDILNMIALREIIT